MVLPLSIAVIGGDSSITMSTAAFFFFFAVVGNKLVLFGVDGKPCDMETALEKTRNGSGGSDGDGIISSYQL